jgi:Tfp pilus assembly protein PilZ
MRPHEKARVYMEKIRAFPRLSLSCDIEYSYVSGGTQQRESVLSKTKDLSQGGICLITTAPLVKGSSIALKFKLHGSQKFIEVRGRVAWTQAFAIGNQMGYDNGIEFTQVSDEDKEIIEKYIKSMFPA